MIDEEGKRRLIVDGMTSHGRDCSEARRVKALAAFWQNFNPHQNLQSSTSQRHHQQSNSYHPK
jgi:hypothetical protein